MKIIETILICGCKCEYNGIFTILFGIFDILFIAFVLAMQSDRFQWWLIKNKIL